MPGRRRFTLLAILALSTMLAPAADMAGAQDVRVFPDTEGASCPMPQGESVEELALVLSGGGARGLAHIGVLRVLDSLDIRPTMVVGTSMGALVGALYSSGATGLELDSIARALPFETLFRRYSPITSLTVGNFESMLQVRSPLFVVEERGTTRRLQSPLAREARVNALFNQLFLRANLMAAGNFDSLPRRYRAVATDIRSRSPVILDGGDLAEAVRASVAIPVVFAPVERNGQTLIDGGLTDNIPVDVARRMGADRLLVAEVTQEGKADSAGLTTGSMLAYLLDELFRQPRDSLGPLDLTIHPSIGQEFGALNFSREAIASLIAMGYAAAAESLQGCMPASTLSSAASDSFPGASDPPASRAMPNVPEAAISLISYRLARLADEGVFEAVWLNPSRQAENAPRVAGIPDSTAAPLTFTPVATPAPQRVASLGLSYDGHEGARAWLSASDVASADDRLSFTGMLSLSERIQELSVSMGAVRNHPLRGSDEGSPDEGSNQFLLPDPRSDAPPWSTLVRYLLRSELSVTASRQIVDLRDEDGRRLDRPATRDLLIFAGFGATPSVGRRIALGPVMHVWSTRGAALPRNDRDASYGALLRAANMFAAPATGPDPYRIPFAAIEGIWMDRYYRFGVEADLHVQAGDLTLRPRGSIGWGAELPLAAQYTLGGAQGFPGLRLHERRGNRAGFASLQALHPIVSVLHASLEFGVGFTSSSQSRLPQLMSGVATGNVFGGEIGVAASTPMGPLRLTYGIARNDRPVFKIRLGG